jgi:molybdopterin molybdotransferase
MELISFEEAYKIVIQSVFPTGTEVIPFVDSLGRILAEDIASDIEMPPFNRSAVDGYACRLSDLHHDLEVLEVIPAGKVPKKAIGLNQCSKIMTGAIVPDGGEVVFMIEDSQKLPDGKIIFKGSDTKTNISIKGEDIKRGDLVLGKGKFIKPQDIAVLASVGHTSVIVNKKPVVAIISTGDELVNPDEFPSFSRIRNSNAYQLLAQVSRAGGIGVDYGIVPDNEKKTFEILEKSIAASDIVILTGGVSMGDFDFVPDIMKRAGVNILFDRVNVKPGKPTTFGVHPKTIIFGLPGNPVSSFIQFEMLVRPLICKMMRYDWSPLEQVLPMAVTYKRKSADRLGLIPVLINEKGEVLPVDFHGSAHITALPYSDGIIAIGTGVHNIKKGEMISVRQI